VCIKEDKKKKSGGCVGGVGVWVKKRTSQCKKKKKIRGKKLVWLSGKKASIEGENEVAYVRIIETTCVQHMRVKLADT